MKTQEWTFKSSSSDAIYTTKRDADGVLSCNCMGWLIKRGDRERECKHTRQVSAQFGSSPTPVVKVAAPPSRSIPAPMLASAMVVPVTAKAFDLAYAGWVMEEKFDGHRASIVVSAAGVHAWSRPRAGESAKAREIPKSIIDAMAHLSPGVYDGELIVPGGKSWDVTAAGSRLMFVAFDVVEIAGANVMKHSYAKRRAILLDELRKLPRDQTAVTTTRSLPASWKEVEVIWKRGGEGAILKRVDSTYRAGYRSPDWVKVKQLQADTLTLTGFEAGERGPYSMLQLRNKDGLMTSVKTQGNEMLREIARNPQSYIGKRVVVSYQLRTPSGSYRHIQFDHFAGKGE